MGDNYTYFGVNMTKAVRDGEVSEERAQDMATRIIAAYYKLGQDEGFPEVAIRAFQLDEAPYVPVQGMCVFSAVMQRSMLESINQ